MNHSTLFARQSWTSLHRAVALLSAVALSACSPSGTSTTPQTASQSIVAASSVAVEPPVKALALSSACTSALEVLNTCAHEAQCGPDISMFLPSAARSQWVAASQTPGFNEDAFNRYCEAACRSKSGAVDQAAFAADVCGSKGGPAASSASAPSAAASHDGAISIILGKDLSVSAEPVPLSRVHQALGEPLKTEKSPHECDSAYEADNIKLLTYAHAAFESDGKTAVLRWADLGPSLGTLDFATKVPGSTLSFEAFKSSSGLKPMEIDASTLRVPTRKGASLESAYDLKYSKGQLTRIELWIGC
ncbi:putative periplasmic lipoprotein [Ideonella paludis]